MFDSFYRAGSVGKKLNVHISRCYRRWGHGRVIGGIDHIYMHVQHLLHNFM